MLAARDQENRIHSRQVAGAAKALQSQAGRHQQAKPPGNTFAPKTPFKIPLNDENARQGLATGKPVLTTRVKGNENLRPVGKGPGLGDAFKTPTGVRAPLRQKTTNAKARTLQIAADAPEGDLAKSKQKSASARKKGPRVSHAKPQLVFSEESLDDEHDIGVIHPRPKDLPDVPDDLPEIDLSFMPQNHAHAAAMALYHYPEPDGLSLAQKERIKKAEEMRILEAQEEAMIKRSVDLHAPPPCMHEPECDLECKDEPERRRHIEEEYQRTLAAIERSRKPTVKSKKNIQSTVIRKKALDSSLKTTVIPSRNSNKPVKSNSAPSDPSLAQLRTAATHLSMKPSTGARPVTTSAPRTTVRAAGSAPTGTRKGPSPSLVNPSRHAVARQVSNTTMGYAKSRAVSGTRRKSILPRSDAVVFQAPSAHDLSTEADEESRQRQEEMYRMMVEDALDDFQLEMPEA